MKTEVRETAGTTASDPMRAFHVSLSESVGTKSRRWCAYVVLAWAILVAYWLVRNTTWHSDDRLHTLLSVLATSLALAAGVAALMRFYSRQDSSRRDNGLLFVGAAFIGTALLEGYHAVVTSLPFANAFPSDAESMMSWSGVFAQMFLSMFLFLSWVFWRRGTRGSSGFLGGPKGTYTAVAVATTVGVALLSLVSLPQVYFPEFWIHRPVELVPAALFLLALVVYLRAGYWRHLTFVHWLVLSLIIGFMAQSLFMSQHRDTFDVMFDAAHILVVLSYAFVLLGLLISTFKVFQQAETNVVDLARQTVELEEARDVALEAVETRSRFLTNVSHELRTPMNAILGMTDLALSTNLTIEQREYLDTTRTSAEALITIINDLLDLSKIEAEKLELDSVPFSLRDTVGDTVRALSISATQDGVRVVWDIADSVPDTLVGDPGRLRQVLVNLIGNAIKFTRDGQIRVSVDLDSLWDDHAVIRFNVQDTGIGIPPEKLGYIFEAFAQADESTTRRFGGTGLGLTISRQIVSLMDGRMWVESTLGEGSTFHFTTNLALFDETQADLPVQTEGATPPVLLMTVRGDGGADLVEMMDQGGIRPIVVDSPSAAMAVLDRSSPTQTPRVLLVDDDNATFERCREIMRNPELSALSVIALVPDGKRGDAVQYRILGITAYLTKPVLRTDLIETIALVSAENHSKGAFVTIHSLREKRKRLSVLLADDSPANRQLIIRLLELRGHSVVATENGVQALRAWKEGDFDVILMDMQMPRMDGIEATTAIRERETGDHHVAIVALTGNTSDSDRERCEKAGMQAFLSKPFRAEELYKAIEQVQAGSTEISAAQTEENNPPDAIDREAVLQQVGGSAELVAEIAGIFIRECPGLMESINDGLEAEDLDPVRRASHRLKGSLGMLAALPAHRAALILEHSADSGELDEALDAWENLRAEMQRLEPELAALASGDI